MAKLLSKRVNKKDVETTDAISLVKSLIQFNQERAKLVKSNKSLLSKISTANSKSTINRTDIIASRAVFKDNRHRRAEVMEKSCKGYFMANNVSGAMKHYGKANKRVVVEEIATNEITA